MRIVIEEQDFKRFSADTQREIVEKLVGKGLFGRTPAPRKRKAKLGWSSPFDLTPDLTVRLMHGLSEDHKARLRLFAQNNGRVRQSQLLEISHNKDLRSLSHFQAVLTRRLRRFVEDADRRLHLIGWDYSATKWDKDHAHIVDGIYYVTEATHRALRDYFGIESRGRGKG